MFNWRRMRGWRVTGAFGVFDTGQQFRLSQHKLAQTGSHKRSNNSTPDFSSAVPPRSSCIISSCIKPQTFSDNLQGIHSIHSPHPTNPFLSISPRFASPSPSLVNPVTQHLLEPNRKPIQRRRYEQRVFIVPSILPQIRRYPPLTSV